MFKISNIVKLGIGIPCNYGVVPSAFLQSLLMMEKPDYELLLADQGDIPTMRNQIVKGALKSKCTHLIMLDTDMLYHPKTIIRLLSLKRNVVGALCYRRHVPFDPLMYKGTIGNYYSIDEWQKGEIVEVDATGTGCLMFNMDIFRAMPSPWFKNGTTEDGKPIGEDIGFCADLRAAGYKIYVDTNIPAGHLTTMIITDETYRLYKALKMKQATKSKPLKEVHCGF